MVNDIVGVLILLYLLSVLFSSSMGLISTVIVNIKFNSIDRAPQKLKDYDKLCYNKSLIPFINIYYGLLFIINVIKY